MHLLVLFQNNDVLRIFSLIGLVTASFFNFSMVSALNAVWLTDCAAATRLDSTDYIWVQW